MEERKRDPKREQEDKIRCANYLLDMFIKYGPEMRAKKEKEATRLFFFFFCVFKV